MPELSKIYHARCQLTISTDKDVILDEKPWILSAFEMNS